MRKPHSPNSASQAGGRLRQKSTGTIADRGCDSDPLPVRLKKRGIEMTARCRKNYRQLREDGGRKLSCSKRRGMAANQDQAFDVLTKRPVDFVLLDLAVQPQSAFGASRGLEEMRSAQKTLGAEIASTGRADLKQVLTWLQQQLARHSA